MWKSGVRLAHCVLFPTAAGEGPPQHAAAPPAGDLQSAQLHGPFCRSGKAVQCGSSENHWKIRASEYWNQDVSRKSFQKDWGFAWSFLCTWPQSYMGARLHVHSLIPITCWERLRRWPTTPWVVSWGRSAFLSLRGCLSASWASRLGIESTLLAGRVGAGSPLRGPVSMEKEEATCLCLVLGQAFQMRTVNSEVRIVSLELKELRLRKWHKCTWKYSNKQT